MTRCDRTVQSNKEALGGSASMGAAVLADRGNEQSVGSVRTLLYVQCSSRVGAHSTTVTDGRKTSDE